LKKLKNKLNFSSHLIFWGIIILIAFAFFKINENSKKPGKVISQSQTVASTKKEAISETSNTSAAPKKVSDQTSESAKVRIVPWSNVYKTAPVNDILIDPIGSVWAATEKGIAKIRNNAITYYRQEQGNFPVPQAECLAHDGKQLWIGTLYGLFSLRLNGLPEKIPGSEQLPSQIIWSLANDGLTIWVGTQNGIAFLNKKEKFQIINEKISNGGLRHGWCQNLLRFSSWLITAHDKGLSFWNTNFPASNPEVWKNIDFFKSEIPRPITDTAFDGKYLWMTSSKGVFCLTTPLKNLFATQMSNFVNFSEIHGLPSDKVNAIVAHKGTIWIGTDAGLAMIKGDTVAILSPASGHFSPKIRALAASGDLLWIGTDKGLHYMNTAMVN
jgi:ligand-binding sensor domain-containing protein